MFRAKLKSFVLGTMLVSALGLAGAAAPPGKPRTYDALLPMVAPTMISAPLGPEVPEQVRQLLEDKQHQQITAKLPDTPQQESEPSDAPPPIEVPPSAPVDHKQPNRQSEQQRSALYVDLNDYVLKAIAGYRGKDYPYLLNTDYANYNGVTTNIHYQDKLLLKAHPSGNRASHCVGITFEVFFRAMQARNAEVGLSKDDFNRMTFSELQDFMLLWYAAQGPKETSNPAYAIVKYGLGEQIHDWKEAKAGDFIDFSRTNGTGHSVVFINWLRRDGAIVGLRYWSSQESTGGIAYKEEYFSTENRGGILTDGFYIGRVAAIADYR
jgi:hypothetical protein